MSAGRWILWSSQSVYIVWALLEDLIGYNMGVKLWQYGAAQVPMMLQIPEFSAAASISEGRSLKHIIIA